MKKLILTCLLSFTCFAGFSQFVLTPRGFVIDGYKNSVVLEVSFEGKTQNELSKLTYKFLDEVFEDSEGMQLSLLRNENVTINGLAEDAVKWRNYGKHELYMDMVFEQVYYFKNSRLLISLPEIYEMFSGTLPAQLVKVKEHAAGGVYIYGKNGKVKYPILKESLENFFNDLVHGLIHYIDSGGEHDHDDH